MKVVYATATAVAGQFAIQGGTHWPADDPVVVANPGLFSDDARYGLVFSAEPEGYRDPAPAREKRAYVRHQ